MLGPEIYQSLTEVLFLIKNKDYTTSEWIKDFRTEWGMYCPEMNDLGE
jgi:hypothetical protein